MIWFVQDWFAKDIFRSVEGLGLHGDPSLRPAMCDKVHSYGLNMFNMGYTLSFYILPYIAGSKPRICVPKCDGS